MSQARNQLIATRDHIRTLYIAIVVLLILSIAQWFRNGYLQETRRIYVPPNMVQGIVTSFDDVPPPVVYTFGLYIFQQLNRWPHDGQKDYPQKIYSLQGFLTPSCISSFQDDMNKKSRLGELRNRSRMVQEISGQGFSSPRVQQITEDSWQIFLDMNVTETIANHDVKNVNVRYTLRVTHFDVDREINPWGLALECVTDIAPTLLSEEDLNQPFTPPL